MAVALGYAFYGLADRVAYLFVDVFAQQVVDTAFAGASGSVDGLLTNFAIPAPERLTFGIGGTVFHYGLILVEALALLFVAVAGLGLWRLRLRRLAECPHCLSRIPRAAAVCRECSLEVAA